MVPGCRQPRRGSAKLASRSVRVAERRHLVVNLRRLPVGALFCLEPIGRQCTAVRAGACNPRPEHSGVRQQICRHRAIAMPHHRDALRSTTSIDAANQRDLHDAFVTALEDLLCVTTQQRYAGRFDFVLRGEWLPNGPEQACCVGGQQPVEDLGGCGIVSHRVIRALPAESFARSAAPSRQAKG